MHRGKNERRHERRGGGDMDEHQKGDSPDLDAARGLLPAIVVGAAVWAIVFAIAALLWGCAAPTAH
jgi:hypothetical protein